MCPLVWLRQKLRFKIFLHAVGFTRKSYLTRKVAEIADLILAPFSKLRCDYEGIVGVDNETYNLIFKIQHHAFGIRGCSSIFVDEFCGFDYRYLAVVAQLNAASKT